MNYQKVITYRQTRHPRGGTKRLTQRGSSQCAQRRCASFLDSCRLNLFRPLGFIGRGSEERQAFFLKFCSLCLSLFLVGSCQDTPDTSSAKTPKEMTQMSRGELVRYRYALQDRTLYTPDMFLTLDAPRVALILAQPDLNRHDGRAKMWQYVSGECVLDIYFMGDQVSYYESRTREGAMLKNARDCIGQVYHARRAQIASLSLSKRRLILKRT